VERCTKIAVTVWTCAALALEVWLLHPSWRQLPIITLVAIAGMAALSKVDRRAVGIVLAAAYVFPVVVRYTRGLQSTLYGVIWMAAIVGVMLPDLVRTRWHLPRRWRAPLVFSVLAVAVSSLVVLVREVDGIADLLTHMDSAYWRSGPPAFTIVWAFHVALTLVIGVLFFDWLCGSATIDFERTIVTPLVGSAFVLAIAVVYQVFVDPRFLNQTVFYAIGRATGTTYDANVTGVVAALWLGGTWLWASQLGGWRLYFAPFATFALLVAVWGSGSRTAFACAAGAVTGVGASLLFKNGAFRKRSALVAASVFVLLCCAVAWFAADPRANNPVARFQQMLIRYPSRDALIGEMWERNGYGTVATYVIRRSPASGVGVGVFHGIVTGMGHSQFGLRLPPDNAQNWLRHQIAEFGFLGGTGWILWFVGFAVFVGIPARSEPDSIWMARGMLAAFGFISLFGMPGQDPMVAITFWVIAAWYTRLRGMPAAGGPIPSWGWALMATALVVFAVMSVVAAQHWLRPPLRAQLARQPFSYGFAPVIGAGPDTGYRGVNTRAAAVVEPQARWLAVTVRLGHDTSKAPVDVRVWNNGEIVLKAQVTSPEPFTGFTRVGEGGGTVLLETSARPQGTPRWWPFTGDSGVLMKWEFLDNIPASFNRYPSD
jgi:hypothetical protein